MTVWDLPTRVFHWALVVAVAVSYLTGGEEGRWFTVHVLSAYTVAALLLFRVVWGIIGSPRSRFSDFVHGWPTVRDYAAKLARLAPPRSIGHNPAWRLDGCCPAGNARGHGRDWLGRG